MATFIPAKVPTSNLLTFAFGRRTNGYGGGLNEGCNDDHCLIPLVR